MGSFFNKVFLNISDPHRLGRNVKAILKKLSANTYEFFVVIFLTIKIYRKYIKLRVPLTQILMLDTAINVTRALEERNIDYYLIGGSLLGAIRQQAFAGRPSDFDIAIKEQDWQRVLSMHPKFAEMGLSVKDHTSIRLDKTSYGGVVHIWPRSLRPKTRWGMIDIHVHEQVGEQWRFKYSDPHLDEVPKFQILLDFPKQSELKIGKIFGYLFPIPTNYEEYLLKAFGEHWRIPVGYKEYYLR